MVVLCTFVFLFLAGFVNTEGDLLKACAVEDIECLNQSTEQFLGQTSNGIPKYDIKSIDPVIVPELNMDGEDNEYRYHFTNISVTGLKNQKISDFKMDLKEKSVILSTKAALTILGNIYAPYYKYTGKASFESEVLGTMQYNYRLEKDANGVEHFIVGPETISCEVIGEPQFKFDPEEPKEIYTKEPADKIMASRKRELCQLVKILFADVVHNIRAAAKLFPKTAFFSNV